MRYWIARKKDELPRVAEYASSLFALEKNGFMLTQIKDLPKERYIYIAKDMK